MDLVDSSLLADMILQWHHEPPSCTLTDGTELHNLHASLDNIHSNIMDSMLVDIPELPEPFAATNSLAKPVSSIALWSGGGQNEFVSDPRVGVSERMVRLPPVVQRGGCGFDVSLVKASDPDSLQLLDSEPFDDPPEVKPTRRARKGAIKATETAKRRKVFDGEQMKLNRAPTHAEHIIRERQRRDDMASKYLILESMLPRAPKVHWTPCSLTFPTCMCPSSLLPSTDISSHRFQSSQSINFPQALVFGQRLKFQECNLVLGH